MMSEENAVKKSSDNPKIVPYSCVFIDAEVGSFWKSMSFCWGSGGSGSREEAIQRVRGLMETDQNPSPALPCLSVRSAFDLFLSAHFFPPDSQLIMTAINIPGMVDIVRYHKLTPVALDLDSKPMGASARNLRALLTTKTVGVVVAHLFGRWMEVESLQAVAAEAGIFFVEDCAECFQGLGYLGHPKSDLCLFSFGIIKYQTCFGGAVAKVRDATVLEKMRFILSSYPRQTSGQYLSKIVKYFCLLPLLNYPSTMRVGFHITRGLGIDHKSMVVKLLRAFPADLIKSIRFQPCDALLTTMGERLEKGQDIDQVQHKGDFATALLSSVADIPGQDAQRIGYWLFPILVPNADQVVTFLNKYGVDAYTKASQLSLVESQANPDQAIQFLQCVVYLPIHKNVPYKTIDHICQLVRRAIDSIPSNKFVSKL